MQVAVDIDEVKKILDSGIIIQTLNDKGYSVGAISFILQAILNEIDKVRYKNKAN